MRVSLRWKAVALFVVVTAAPALVATEALLDVNRVAVETSEARVQAAVVAEITRAATAEVARAKRDAEAVADELADAAKTPTGPDGLDGVRAILATRTAFDAVRFEVPSAKVSTVVKKPTAKSQPAPSSDALRARADRFGSALLSGTDGHALLVVPIPTDAPNAARGYVTADVDLAGFSSDLAAVLASRFDRGSANVVVVDEDRQVVAAAGPLAPRVGESAKTLPVLGALPPGTPFTAAFGAVSPHETQGRRMVGAVQTVPEVAWAVALYRPEADAYSALTEMRRRGFLVVGASLLLALLAALGTATAVTRPVLALAEQARRIGARRWRDVTIDRSRNDELGDLATSLGTMARDLERGEAELVRETALRADLGRFLSKDLVEAIVKGEHALALGGRRAEISVLFADVVAFTALAETQSPEKVVALLNELFTVLTEVVFRHGGTVDKFIGDCIMAVWGAPQSTPDHAQRALACAEDMMRFLETANEDFRARYGAEIRLGIGVNSGEALVGNIGSEARMEYTVIGDVVNVAARLEAIARPNQVLVAERTAELAGESFELTLLGERALTGRKEPTRVHELALA